MSKPVYFPEYRPESPHQFDSMFDFFMKSDSEKDLLQRMMLFVLDMNYDRQDILVARKRAARNLGFVIS